MVVLRSARHRARTAAEIAVVVAYRGDSRVALNRASVGTNFCRKAVFHDIIFQKIIRFHRRGTQVRRPFRGASELVTYILLVTLHNAFTICAPTRGV